MHVRWRMHRGSGARAFVSVAGCGSTGAAPCDRLRRFLRPGLGPGFGQMVCSPSVSVRLSRHTDRGNRVADRICEFVDVIGDRERVIASTDCGFGTFATYTFVAEDVVWAKLQMLSEGARIATERLWGKKPN